LADELLVAPSFDRVDGKEADAALAVGKDVKVSTDHDVRGYEEKYSLDISVLQRY